MNISGKSVIISSRLLKNYGVKEAMKLVNVLLIIALITAYVLIHELTHYTIAVYEYGCEASFFVDNAALGVEYWDCDSDPSLAQSINEIVGYNISLFLVVIIVIMTFNKRNDDKR
jgi:hypothetical protein